MNKSSKRIIIVFSIIALLIVFVTIAGFALLFRNDKTDPLVYLPKQFSEIEKKYIDDDGYVSPSDVSSLLDEILDCVNDMPSVIYCEKNDTSVYYILEDNLGVHYMAPIKDIASSGDDLAIYSYQPYYDNFTKGTKNLLNNGNYPNKASDQLVKLTITNDSATPLYNKDVTIEKVKKMCGDSVILWVGHGGYSTKYHSTLLLLVEYSEKLHKKYKDDFDNHRLEISYAEGSYRVCVTSHFFEHYLEEGSLSNSIIYLGACNSGRDNVLISTLINKGASSIYGNSNSVYQQYNHRMCKSVIDALCKGETTEDALSYARSENGENDNVIFGIFNTDARVYCYGEKDLTLEKLYSRINSNANNDSSSKPSDDTPSTPTENPTTPNGQATPLKLGDHIYFGSAVSGEEAEIWQVVNVDGSYALIYNLYMYPGVFDSTIHAQTEAVSLTRYNSYGSATWEYSDVRSWLNSRDATVQYQDVQFDYNTGGIATVPWPSDKAPTYLDSSAGYLNRFTDEEYSIIQPVTHQSLIPYTQSGKSSVYDADLKDFTIDLHPFYQEPYGVSETTDLMFLLNGWEFKNYVLDNNLWGFNYPNGKSLASFWLRDSVNTDFARFYGYFGTHMLTAGNGKAGSSQADLEAAIRPACYIDVSYISILSGSGSFDDPYRLTIDCTAIDCERVPHYIPENNSVD